MGRQIDPFQTVLIGQRIGQRLGRQRTRGTQDFTCLLYTSL